MVATHALPSAMRTTYKAIEVTTPGTFRIVERSLVEPAQGQVCVPVEACGICHTDMFTVTGTYPV